MWEGVLDTSIGQYTYCLVIKYDSQIPGSTRDMKNYTEQFVWQEPNWVKQVGFQAGLVLNQ